MRVCDGEVDVQKTSWRGSNSMFAIFYFVFLKFKFWCWRGSVHHA